MTNSPFFSVVIPTYNRAGFIRQTIESVLAQSFRSYEIIVVDDGSTDDTEVVVKSILDDHIQFVKRDNVERAAARNFGATIAQGQYVNFLDSDDVVYPHHLETANEICKMNQGVEIFHLGYDIKDQQGNLQRSVSDIQSINHQIVSGNILSCNGVFIRKDIILKNRFDEDRALSSLEDWELWIRMSARYPFLNSNKITSTVIQHEKRSVMTANRLKIKQKVDCFVHCVLSDEMNKAHYGSSLKKVVASAWTYAALHLVMADENKGEVLRYLLKGIQSNPGEVMKKRFLVVVIKLLGI